MKIYFIGAGPGDPGLLTIKAKNIISLADIIIYAGSLVNPRILEFAARHVQVYDSSSKSLPEILKIMRKERATQKVIARIHSGDPCLYSALQEQLAWCERNKIDYEVIPGVSSFCAAAASLKQELTLPNISQTLIITRVSGRTKVPAKEDLRVLSRIKATLAIFLSVAQIEEVVARLLCGYSPKTPAAIVVRASWPDEKIIRARLDKIVAKVKQEKISRQALIFVGEVLGRKGFKNSRLYDEDFSHSYRK